MGFFDNFSTFALDTFVVELKKLTPEDRKIIKEFLTDILPDKLKKDGD